MRRIEISKRTLLGALLIAGIAVLPAAVRAEDLVTKGKDGGLTVAFYNYNPNSYIDQSGKLVGTDPETLIPVLQSMGLKVAATQDTDWGNLIPGLNAGRFDVIAAGMYITPERCDQVAFSQPIFGFTQSLAIKKGNPDGIASLEDIAAKGLTVAAIAGSGQVGYSQLAGIPDDKILQIPDTATAVAAIRAGRASAFVVDTGGIKALVEGLPEKDLEATKPFSEVKGKTVVPHGAIAFRKQDAAFVVEFDKALEKRVHSPEHIAMLEAHGFSKNDLPRFTREQLCSGTK
ncbi:ectoine/hydroxyectoine ABC transporter substrate-binding protein EhuB [Labrys neptuniae]